jgi:hypothetical protein
VHLEAPRALRDGGADPAEADDADRRAGDLVALERLVRPAAPPPTGPDEGVAGDDPAAHGEDQSEREVGGRRRRDARRVRNCDAAPPASLDVDEIEAGAVVRDDPEARQQVELAVVDALRDNRQRLDVRPRIGQRPVEILDVSELVPCRAGKPP